MPTSSFVDIVIGGTLLALRADAAAKDDWVNRRVEKMEFLDTRAVRWRISIDFRVPTLAPFCPSGPPGYRLIPLTAFPKEDLVAFDLRDERDHVMWLPTAAELSPLLVPAVVEMAKRVLGVKNVPDDIAKSIEKIITEPPARHEEAYSPFRAAAEKIDSEALYRSISVLGDELSDVGINTLYRLGHLAIKWRADRWRKKADARWARVPDRINGPILLLMRNQSFRSQLEELEFNYIAYAAVESQPEMRRIVKLSCERRMRFRLDRGVVRRVLRSAGWLHWAMDVFIGGDGGSHNFEVTAPPGVDILRITAKPQDPRDRGKYPEITRHGYLPRVSMRIPPTGHCRYQAAVYMRICPAGWLFASLAVTVVIAAAMIMGWHDLAAFYEHSGHTATREADTAAALLSALLALIATWLVRPGEHPLASRLLFLVRVLLGLDALDVLIGTGYLVLRGSGGVPSSQLWGWLAMFAVIIAGLVFVSWLIPAIHGLRQKRRLRLY